MSDMVKARELMKEANAKIDKGLELIEEGNELLRRSFELTIREQAVRRAPSRDVIITDDLRDAVMKLAKNKNMTQTEIARRVGLRNCGRVSEILNGKR